MKKFIKLGLLGTCFISGFTGASAGDDLADAVRFAIATHPKLSAEASGRDAVADKIGIEKSSYFPKVTIFGGAGREWSENANTRTNVLFGGDQSATLLRKESGVIISQNLFSGFLNDAKVKIAKNDLVAADANVDVERERLALRTIEVYIGVYRLRQVVQLLEENLTRHKVILNEIKSRASSGIGNTADVNLAKGRVALAQAGLTKAIGALRKAEIDYKEVVSVEPGSFGAPIMPENTLPKSRAVAIDEAMQTHPALKGALAQADSSKAAVKASKSSYYPTVSLDVGANYNENLNGVVGKSKDVSAMLRLSYNLFEGGARKHRVAVARNERQRTSYLIKNLERTIEKNVDNAWVDLQTQKVRQTTLQEHANSALTVVNAYQKQFNFGRRTLLDLMNAHSEVINAQINLVNGEADFYFSKYRILAAMGNVSGKL